MEVVDKMSFQSMVETGDVNLVLSLLDRTKKEDTSNLPQTNFAQIHGSSAVKHFVL